MQLEIKKELNRSYFVIEEKESLMQTYCMKMITENRIPGLLPAEARHVDDRVRLYYDISGLMNLKGMYSEASLTYEAICSFLHRMIFCLEMAEEYLLDKECFLLHPDLIFYKGEEILFCYFPAFSQDLETSFRSLMEWMLARVDYDDTDAVRLIYRLNAKVRRDGFGLVDVVKILAQKEPEEEAFSTGIPDWPWESGDGTDPERFYSEADEAAGAETEAEDLPEKRRSASRIKSLVHGFVSQAQSIEQKKRNLLIALIVIVAVACIAILGVDKAVRIQAMSGMLIFSVLLLYVIERQKERFAKWKEQIRENYRKNHYPEEKDLTSAG